MRKLGFIAIDFLDEQRFKKEIDNIFFANRVVNKWNKLNRKAVSAHTIEKFKRGINKFMHENEMISGAQELSSVDRMTYVPLIFFPFAMQTPH